jgi:hypothetical protein
MIPRHRVFAYLQSYYDSSSVRLQLLTFVRDSLQYNFYYSMGSLKGMYHFCHLKRVTTL